MPDPLSKLTSFPVSVASPLPATPPSATPTCFGKASGNFLGLFSSLCEQEVARDAAVAVDSDGSAVAILKFCLVRIVVAAVVLVVVVVVFVVAGGK